MSRDAAPFILPSRFGRPWLPARNQNPLQHLTSASQVSNGVSYRTAMRAEASAPPLPFGESQHGNTPVHSQPPPNHFFPATLGGGQPSHPAAFSGPWSQPSQQDPILSSYPAELSDSQGPGGSGQFAVPAPLTAPSQPSQTAARLLDQLQGKMIAKEQVHKVLDNIRTDVQSLFNSQQAFKTLVERLEERMNATAAQQTAADNDVTSMLTKLTASVLGVQESIQVLAEDTKRPFTADMAMQTSPMAVKSPDYLHRCEALASHPSDPARILHAPQRRPRSNQKCSNVSEDEKNKRKYPSGVTSNQSKRAKLHPASESNGRDAGTHPHSAVANVVQACNQALDGVHNPIKSMMHISRQKQIVHRPTVQAACQQDGTNDLMDSDDDEISRRLARRMQRYRRYMQSRGEAVGAGAQNTASESQSCISGKKQY